MLYIKDTFLKIKAFLFNPYYKLIFLSCLFIYSCGTEVNLQESLRKKQLKEEKRKARKDKRKERKSNKGFLAYYNTYYQAKVKFREALERIELNNYNNLNSEIKPPISSQTKKLLDESVKYADVILDDYYNTDLVDDASYIKARASYLNNVMSPSVYFFNKIIEDKESPYYYDSLVRLGFIRLLVDDKEGLRNILIQLDNNTDNFKDNIKKLKKKLPYKFIQQDLKNVIGLYYYLKAKAAPFIGNSLEETEIYYVNAINNTEDETINKKIYYYHQLIAFLEENDKHESVVKYMNEVADLVYVATLSEEFLLKWLDYNREYGLHESLHKRIDKILKRNVESFKDEIFFLIEKAKTYIDIGETDKGIAALYDIVEVYGEDELNAQKDLYSELYYQLGKVSLDENEFSDAYNYFNQSFDIKSNSKNSNITNKLKKLTSLKEEYLILTDTTNIVIETEIHSSGTVQEENNPFFVPVPDTLQIEDSYIDSLLFGMGKIFYYDLEIEDFAVSSLSELLKDYKNSQFVPDAVKMLNRIKPEINWVDSFAIDLFQFIEYDDDIIESSKIEKERDIAFKEMSIDINKAITLFESNYNKYDDLLSLYMIGYIYDKYLNNTKQTLKYYQLYIDRVDPLYGNYKSVSNDIYIRKLENLSDLQKFKKEFSELYRFGRLSEELREREKKGRFKYLIWKDSLKIKDAESRINLNEKNNSKPTLINIWQKSCLTCANDVDELIKKYYNTDLQIINILDTENEVLDIDYLEELVEYEDSLNYPYPIYQLSERSIIPENKSYRKINQLQTLVINNDLIMHSSAKYYDRDKIKINQLINQILNDEANLQSNPRFYPPFLALEHLSEAENKIEKIKQDFNNELKTKYALKLFKEGYDLIHNYGIEYVDSARFYHIKEGAKFVKSGRLRDLYNDWDKIKLDLDKIVDIPSLKVLEEDLFDTSIVKEDDIFLAATLLYKGFNNKKHAKKYYEIYANKFSNSNDIEKVYLALKQIDFENKDKWDSLYIEKIKSDFSEYEKLNFDKANDIMAVVKQRQQPKDLALSYTVKYKEVERKLNRLYIPDGQQQIITFTSSGSKKNTPFVSSEEVYKDSLYQVSGKKHNTKRGTLKYDSKSITKGKEVDYNCLSSILPIIYGSNIYYAEFLYRSKDDYRFRLNKNIDKCNYKGDMYSCFEIESYPKNDIIIPENFINVLLGNNIYEADRESWGRNNKSFEIGKHITKIIEIEDNILIPIEDITLNFGLDTMVVKQIEYENIADIYYIPKQIKISNKDDDNDIYVKLDKYSINNSLHEYDDLFFYRYISDIKQDKNKPVYLQPRKRNENYLNGSEWINQFIGLSSVEFDEYDDIDIKQVDKEIDYLEKLYYELYDENWILPEPEKDNRHKRKPSDPDFVHDINQGESYSAGNENASITITKFFDFQCPYSAISSDLIEQILDKYPLDVKVVFKSFPLGSHKQAFKAAKYALAAGRQGKFYELYSKIFEGDNWRGLKNNEDLPKTYAAELGLDIGQLERDMNDSALEAQINAEYNQLKALENSYDTEQYAGVRLAVPKFFINGREPSGRTIQDWSKVIEEEICKNDTLEINYYSDGSKRYEVSLEDCKREGLAQYWNKLGNLSKTAEFRNGKLNGEQNKYYVSGAIKEKSTYKNDKLDGVVETYNENGNVINTVVYKNGLSEVPEYVIFSINDIAANYVQSTKQYFYFVDDAFIDGEKLKSDDWLVAYNNSTIVGARQYVEDNTDVPIMGFDSLTESLKIATEGYCEIGNIPTIRVYRSNGDIVDMDVTATEGELEFKGIGHARVILNGTIKE